LHYIELGSPNPQRMAEFYGDILGMQVRRVGTSYFCAGAERQIVISPGARNALLSSGFALTEPEVLQGICARLGDRPPLAGVAREFFTDGVTVADPDGNRMSLGRVAAASNTTPSSAASLPARLQHIVLGSTDIERLARFYVDTVGFKISDRVLDDAGVARTFFLRSDDEHHTLAMFHTSSNRLDHHCYETPEWNSIRDWGDRLAAHAVEIKWGPGRHGPGNNLFLFFHDPDGNWLELSAELERVDAARPVVDWPHNERTLNSWGRAFLRT
jgi:catechol 2,3-dioxygenase-like lactoylglutathione lyase family enzyme